jgi:hypothetical protein
MSILKMWAISRVIGDGTPGTNPYRPALSDDFPEIEWRDILVAAPPYVPPVAISRTINDDVTGVAIHQAARSLILAAQEDIGDEWVDYTRSGNNWGPDQPFFATHWTQIRDGLVQLGMDADDIDGWRSNHPNATRREFYGALLNFIKRQEN